MLDLSAIVPASIPPITHCTTALACLLREARAANPSDPQRVERCIQQAMLLLHVSVPDAARASDPFIPAAGTRSTVGSVTTRAVNGFTFWQTRRIKDYITLNLADRLPVSDLAIQVRLSTGYFIRSFRITFGVTPRVYIMQQRVARARQLMLSTDSSLAEVALACGLADQAHFSRLFRRIQGQSPAAWRRDQAAGAGAGSDEARPVTRSTASEPPPS